MTALVVKNLEFEVQNALEQRAIGHGWTMEEEIHEILRKSVREGNSNLQNRHNKIGTSIANRFIDCGLNAPIHELHGDINPLKFCK